MTTPDIEPDVEGPRIDPAEVTRFRRENPTVIATNEAAAQR